MHKHAGVAVVVLLVAGCSPELAGPGGGGGGTSATGGSGGGTAGTGGGSPVGGGAATGGSGGGTSVTGGGSGGGAPGSRSDELTAGTRLKVRAVVGVDGSRQQIGFFDSMRMENCGFVFASDGSQRCLPLDNNAGELGYFSDAQCAQRIFGVPSSCAVAPKYGLRFQATTCPYTYEMHSLGPEISPTPTQVFALSGTNCVSISPLATYRLFPSAGTVAPTAFVQGNIVVEP